jgi:hypothetical protein
MNITVAIPLHASLKWVDNIIDNVGRIPLNVERIVVSDRTCVDNAAEVLRQQFRHDKRVTVTWRDEGLSWPSHCQQLMDEDNSQYMMFMPHDDIFPQSWIPALHQMLQEHPEALLAYGRVQLVGEDGGTLAGTSSFSQLPGIELEGLNAVNAFLRHEMWIPNRGLFLRKKVLDMGIRLDRTSETPWEGYRMWDEMWVLSMALRGSIVFDDRVVTSKRIHSQSATFLSPIPPLGSTPRAAVIVLREQSKIYRGSLRIRLWIWLYWIFMGISRRIKSKASHVLRNLR